MLLESEKKWNLRLPSQPFGSICWAISCALHCSSIQSAPFWSRGSVGLSKRKSLSPAELFAMSPRWPWISTNWKIMKSWITKYWNRKFVLPKTIWWLASSMNQGIIRNTIWMRLRPGRWGRGRRASNRWSWGISSLGCCIIDDLLRQIMIPALLVIALNSAVVVVVVAAVARNEVTICYDVGAHVSVLNMTLFLLPFLLILLL